MNKQQFIDYLNHRLDILNNKEKNEIIDEYCQHIDMKVENGKTEEEAVKDFGNLDEFVKDILDAYHINTDSKYKKKTLNDYILQVVDFLNRSTESILNKDGKEIARIVLEFILLLIVVRLFEIPFNMFRSFFVYDLFYFFPYTIKAIVYGILGLITNLLFLILTFYAIYYFIKKRVLNNEEISFESFKSEVIRDKDSVIRERKNNAKEKVFDDGNNEAIREDVNINYNNVDANSINRNIKKDKKSSDTAVNLLTLILKIILFFIMLPAFGSMFGLAIASIVLAIFYAQGIGLFSILMVVIGMLLMAMGFSLAILKLIFGGK